MPNLTKDFWTFEQLADRWGIDHQDVQQFVLTRQLPQAFLLTGPARLVQRSASERLLHPFTTQGPAHCGVLAGGTLRLNGLLTWPLAYIERVYEFVIDGYDSPDRLRELCSEERASPSGWLIEFDAADTTIIGQDLMEIASTAFSSSAFVSTDALTAFEQAQGLIPQPEEQQSRTRQARDTRKQRCRVVAQILWERDPTATIPDLYRSDWMQRIACEGKPPTEKTLREWIKDLNPNRAPGRRSI
ncbi:MAG: hypothetical protein K0U79_14925 [Gammaproteobacteria bacterium]|nr:hypothetical protein [Gammaproteobacteria bacterium]